MDSIRLSSHGDSVETRTLTLKHLLAPCWRDWMNESGAGLVSQCALRRYRSTSSSQSVSEMVDRVIDSAETYNVPEGQLQHLRELERERNFYEKGVL
ncbi:hypothetical protein BDW75DRAFT_197255 [Aspergillus navahoensis]